MPTPLIQPSFTGGELSPSLHSRVDLSKYSVSLKTCRNFYVQAHGGVSNRPGTQFIAETKTSSKKSRLIPFEFNTEQTYVLEFGDLYMRVFKDGGQVLSGGSAVEITTPFTSAQVDDLQFTQSADVMTICHSSHAPREVARSSHTSWTLTTISFGASLSAPTGVSVSAQNYDATLDNRSHEYAVTAVDTVTGAESLASSTSSVTNNSLSETRTNTTTWSAVTGADRYNVYKKKGGILAFVGASDTTTFVDDNIDPDTADTAPTNRTIFNATGTYPSTVSYFQQRLAFAQSDNAPQTVWLSQTGNYHNFNVSTPLRDDDGITFTIAAQQVNEIRHMMPLANLVILTSGGEWLMRSADGVLTPVSIVMEPQGYRGANEVPPLLIGNTILYIQSKGSIVRDLSYTLESDSYTGNDLTVLATHLFEGKQVTSWAFAQAPHSVIWAVLSDGSLSALTYMREHEVWGWSRHDTDGTYESVCSVSEGSEDAVYFIVNRTIGGVTKRYVERLHTRVFSDVADAFFVDSGLSYDGTHTGSTTMTLSGGTTWLHGENITLTASASTFVAGDVGNAFVLTIGVETLRCKVTAYTSGTVVTVQAARDVPTAFRSVATSTWSKAVDELSGLGHLEGKSVSILADGNAEAQLTVASGAITLTNPASKIHVGLPIQSDFETLSVEHPKSTIQGKVKSIAKVNLKVKDTRGGRVGPNFERMNEFKQRAYEAYGEPTALRTGDIEVTLPSDWNRLGSVCYRQDDPLPVTILAVIPEITIGH